MRFWTRALLVLAFLVLSVPARGTEPDYTKDPVLMVHGYLLGQTGTWTWLKNQLIEDGWPEGYLFSLQFDNVVGCNPAHAEAVAEMVDTVRAVTGRDKIDIIAHSMGGLDTRYYIKYLCGYRYINDFVTLAGAHKGTIIACLDFFSCGAEQMCVPLDPEGWKDNDFLLDLNSCDQTPGPDIKYTSVWTGSDEIIVPPTNSIIDGARNIKMTALVGHGLILLSEEALGYVKEALNGGGLNDNVIEGEGPCYVDCSPPVVDPSPEPQPEFIEVVEAVEFEDIVEEVEGAYEIIEEEIDPEVDLVELTEETMNPEDLVSVSDGSKEGGESVLDLETVQDTAKGEEDTQPVRSTIQSQADSGCSHDASGSPSVLWIVLLALLGLWLQRFQTSSNPND